MTHEEKGRAVLDRIVKRMRESLGNPITGYFVRFHTEDDDKDGGDIVSAVLLRPKDGEVLAQLPVVGDPSHTWHDQTDQPKSDDSSFGGHTGWFRLAKTNAQLNAGEGGLLIISKTGDKRWKARVDLMVTVQGSDTEFITFRSDKFQLDKNGREFSHFV